MLEGTDYLSILVLWAQKAWPGRPQPSEVQEDPRPLQTTQILCQH